MKDLKRNDKLNKFKRNDKLKINDKLNKLKRNDKV